MRSCSNHQSLRRIGVEGLRPQGTEWYECRCGQRLLVHIIASYPQEKELQEAAKRDIPVTRLFGARDGTQWQSMDEVVRRNNMYTELEELEKYLLPRTKELDDGDGYIQQEVNQVAEVETRLLKLAARAYKRDLTPTTTLAHLIMDIKEEGIERHPIYLLYQRLACIDASGREWQTPSLVEDPESGRQVQLNKAPLRKPSDGFEETPNERGREGTHQPR